MAAVIAAGAMPSRRPRPIPFNEVAEQTNKKLVKLFGAGGFSRLNNFGTGIVICKDGYVLTVASQLLDTSDLVVHLYDGQRLKAQVVVVEPELDAASSRSGRREEARGADRISTSATSTSPRRRSGRAPSRATGCSRSPTRSRSPCATSR